MLATQRYTRFMAALAGGVSAFALAYNQPAMAQQAAQSDQPVAAAGGGLEEVVVTARRKEEKAQSVPITLQTFNQAGLENQQITSSIDFTKALPGVTMSAPGPTAQHTWIRGVTGAVGYFNDAPLLAPGSYDVFFDLASAQVLKGPQGTLFGVATDGGAFVYTPRKPTDNFEGYVEATVGDYGHYALQSSVSIPVIEDKVLVRVAGETTHTDGYIRDIARGINLMNNDLQIGRAIVTLRPTDDLSNEFLAGYYTFHPNSFYVFNSLLRLNYPVLQNKPLGPQIIALAAIQHSLGIYAVVGDDIPGGLFYETDQWNFINTTLWDVNDNLTVKNILSYEQVFNKTDASAFQPLGTIPVSNFYNILANGTQVPYQPPGPTVQYAEELQLQGKALDDKLSFTVGSFNLLTRQASPHPAFQCTNITFGAVNCFGNANSSGATNGLYAQGTYDLASLIDGLSFTAGYRYSWDRLYAQTNSYTQGGIRIPAASGSLVEYSHAPSYTMSLDYQYDPQTLFYVSDSKGYSKGGINSITAPPAYHTYQPENLNSVEIGVKTDNEIFGMKTRMNVDAFYGIYSRVQATQTIPIPPAAPGLPTTYPQVTTNAASAYTEGFDGEFTIIPFNSLELYFNGTYDIAKFDKYNTYNPFVNPPQPVDYTWAPPLNAPKWKWATRLTYHPPIDWIAPGQPLGDLSFTVNWSWESVHNLATNYDPAGFSTSTLEYFPDKSVVDISVNWNDFMGKPGLDATFYITNVNENIWSEQTTGNYVSNGFTGEVPAAPRMMGVTLRYTFGP